MIFSVCRTSDWDFNSAKPPCKDAKKHEYMKEQKSRVYDPYDGKQIVMVRDVKKECWVVEINTLEDLLDLQQEVDDELIIDSKGPCDNLPYIEIYDGYRE